MEYKYVWLEIATGKFSNSWDQKNQDEFLDDSLLELGKKDGWKLIKYQCLTDDDFEFNKFMVIK